MIYFRDKEKEILRQFSENTEKAMAVYGRRRAGKTCLMIDFYNSQGKDKCIYYQCTSYDYLDCLKDFITEIKHLDPDFIDPDRFSTFRDVFRYLDKIGIKDKIFIIDEFPFLAKKDENAVVEFQWIIDHGLGDNKLILLGSSLSFMKKQIGDKEAPLYGRFDRIIEICPFSFDEIKQLFPKREDAVEVYARTGGIAQYVMLYKNYPTVKEADEDLFFNANGRLFKEAENLLMQEVREVTTYVSILRAIGASEKETSQIADKSKIDQKAVFGYLNKLIDLGIIRIIDNPLSEKKKAKRYAIADMLFRFHYTFIESHISLITTLQEKSMEYILDERYSEYLGFAYEEIIRGSSYKYGLNGVFPFMPKTVGKWWGNIKSEGNWKESEVDIIAYDDKNIVIGECKYRNKAIGMNELELLRLKAQFIPVKGRKRFLLLASRSGFTKEVMGIKDPGVILIEGA